MALKTSISSDTNVWIDFATISRVRLPFLLPYNYLMYHEALDNEVLYCNGLKQSLLSAGLIETDLTNEEFYYTEELADSFHQLSRYDCIALAIAKCRGIKLLTGDKALRKVAMAANVEVIGTLWIIDSLFNSKLITSKEYKYCLHALLEHNGSDVRLPAQEIEKRIKTFFNE